ncbi:MAG TPA: hypothetical protein VGU69_14760 [Rhizomicrobium sp.]|nr:hypothetical protein [Rhizomicrobium sp.]
MMYLPACLLMAAALAAWFVAASARPIVRVQLRFATVFFAALGGAALLAGSIVAGGVALIAFPVALAVLAFAMRAAFEGPASQGLVATVLGVVSALAIFAAATGWLTPSLAPAAGAAVGMVIISIREQARMTAIQGALGSLCFIAALCAFTTAGASTACLAFATAGLLGVTLALGRVSDAAVDHGAAMPRRSVVRIGKPR